ncbi:NAD-dependent epimerase/dehydratase family protein [Puniceibacterium sp. IMCC21224]|uniref:NAD-dependent epimerase/dehydratase family protein n=1 Tax=Puniceibacterium sp. IMCC21224 TaxID=1618204 RepID=UPI00065D69E8|nr:NAD-dependent epimerase/dehydratase family protein [Puniceibacterium sp. IMCC21224]KMK66536.1 nucleoside-diphosphate-sugar epimerase [Puniceibacterium sp. IMCC21224]
MTILLTGAGGFLGLNIVEALLAHAIPCVAVNDRPLPPEFSTRPGLTIEIADVRDRAAMAAILQRHDIQGIIHAAAVTLAPTSRMTGADTAFDVNAVSTAVLLDEARKVGVARFVYPSSTAVYGAALYDGTPITEDTPPRPVSVYGYTKLASERLVAETAKSYGSSCVCARITALFGPHERETTTRDMMSLPFQMAQQAMTGKPTVLPAGLQRDWTSSRDVAEALLHLATAPKLEAELYNLGIGAPWNPALLAGHLAVAFPTWQAGIGKPDGSDSTLTLHDDPSQARQPLIATRFERDFGFLFRTPDMACRDYIQWLQSCTNDPVPTPIRTPAIHHPTRDFVGYGPNPPDPRWPGGARIAVNIVVNYEEGAEESFGDGDALSEGGLTEGGGGAFTGRDLGAETMFEYGSRVGVWRLFRLLQQAGVPATVFGCAQALERNPQVAEAIRANGWDVCAHGDRWVRHQMLDAATEQRAIARAFDVIGTLCGEPPAGWYCRYAPSLRTRQLIADHGGFLYDSDSYADELPYWTQVGERDHLVIPYSLTLNDGKFARGNTATAGQFFEFLRDSFDLLYEEGETQPRMMNIGLHCRLMGHPGRALALQRFLRHIQSREKVWICRRVDIARHWMQEHPPKPD